MHAKECDSVDFGVFNPSCLKVYGGNKLKFAIDILYALFVSDLVVFDHVHLALPMGLLSVILKNKFAKIIIFAHGSESWRKVRPLSVLSFQSADIVLANSNFTLRKMQKRFSGFNGVACPLGLPPQFRLNKTLPQSASISIKLRGVDGLMHEIGPRAMLLVGRMDSGERQKGHRELITALPQICNSVPDAQLVFVGGGDDFAAISMLAAHSSASSNIFMPGIIDDKLLTQLYNLSYAYVMPSRQEGFGLVFLEAMNFALPCIACNGDGAADVVVDGVTGILVDQPINQNELVISILSLLSNSNYAQQLGHAGWNRLHKLFTSKDHQLRVQSAVLSLIL